jgi:hypothetical protein
MQLHNLSGALHSAAATSSQQETFGKTLFFQFEPPLPLTHAGDITQRPQTKKNKKNMHYLQNIPKNNVFEKS